MADISNVALLLIVCLVIYHNALDCGFVFDDVSAIKDNKDLRPDAPLIDLFTHDFWGTPMKQEGSHKSYRPLTVLTFRFNYWVGQLKPFGYHLVNVILHSIVTLQFYMFCRQTIEFNKMVSLGSALLFAVHPVHTEAVTGVVGRAELLSASLCLLIFKVYTDRVKLSKQLGLPHLLLLFLLLLSATLCKEQGITISAVCLLYDCFILQQLHIEALCGVAKSVYKAGSGSSISQVIPLLYRCVALALITILTLALRLYVMGAQLPSFTAFDNPASNQSTPYRQLTYNYLTIWNCWLLLCPAQLCCDWTMGTVPVITSLLDYRNLCTIALYVLVGKLIVYSLCNRSTVSDQLFTGLMFILVPFLPASNLFFPVGFVIAERILYMPSIGYCIIAAALFNYLYDRHESVRYRYLLVGGVVLLLLAGACRTHARNKDWRSEFSLFTSALRFTESNAKVWNNVGHALEAEDKYAEALHYFNNAARVQPDDIGSHINVGRTLKQLGRTSEAEKVLTVALSLLPATKKGQSYMARIAPSHLNIFLTLGTLVSQNESRLLEAEKLYKKAISMRPEFVQAYMNYGDILLRMDRNEEALLQYKTALRYDSTNPDIYYNLGVVHLESKRHQQAMDEFNRALSLNPTHQQSLYNSAVIMQESGQVQLLPEAVRRLELLIQLEPDNSKVYFTAALLATDSKRYDLAEQRFKEALKLEPDFKGALFNLALLLANQLQRPTEGVPYLERNLRLNPEHVKSYLLLGDIAINHLKNIDLAEQCFTEIVRLEPNNIQGRHNLCVVYVERGDLHKAESCLLKVQKLAPDEEYIKQHVQIIRHKLSSADKSQT